jgi:hypothetical protein
MHKTKKIEEEEKEAKVPAEVIRDSQQQKQHSGDDTILQKRFFKQRLPEG